MFTLNNGFGLLRAYQKAARRLKRDSDMTAATVSAGMLIPKGQKRGKRKGYQIFVKVCRYSDELLKRKLETGGLECGVP